ncbi:MAG: cation-transporting P-type ATPase [Pseudomonadota bacterium]
MNADSKLTADWHRLPTDDICARLSVDPEKALSSEESRHRVEHYGFNRIQE